MYTMTVDLQGRSLHVNVTIGVSFVHRVRMSSPFARRLFPVAIAFQVLQFRMLFSRAIVILLYNLIFSSRSFMFACCLSIIILLSCVIICSQFTLLTFDVVIGISEGQVTWAVLVEIADEEARNRKRSFRSIIIVSLCEMNDNVKGAFVFILRGCRLESDILRGPRYKECVYIRPLRYALHFIMVQIRVLVIPVKMPSETVKRLTKRKGGASSVKRKPRRKSQKGGTSMKRNPRRKNQKGGFIFNPGFVRNNPFTKMTDSALDYDRRQRRAKKRGKRFKKRKASDNIWEFIERRLG